MTRPDDVPDFPFPKPKEIEKIEQLPPEIIHAMTRVEMEEKIREAATSLAQAYFNCSPSEKANYEECLLLVSAALTETGGAVPGQLGSLLVGTSQKAASEAARELFPNSII